MEQALHVYIPMDRRQTMAQGQSLPDRTSGAALFADISGFTPLTEALTQALGPRRGIEELTRQLNLVYDALVAEVDRYGGSVIGFSGDAITCWFDDAGLGMAGSAGLPSGPARATACALAIQAAMERFAAVPLPGKGTAVLTVKVSVASGSVRRFLVGDPEIQLIDALAGATLMRMAAGEGQAGRGEVVLDTSTLTRLGKGTQVIEWRVDKDSGERFAIVDRLKVAVEPTPWPPLLDALDEERIRPWVLPAVYERLREGLGEFLTELRPVVALFLRFAGIDYDEDEAAGVKLDRYVRWVQEIVARYEGTLIQLTIGDKRSYLYAAFGAPAAHEDDARRASNAALELTAPPADLDFISQVQIGISQGTMRTGTYGGATRRTYGVLGDEVNLAARLMQHVPEGHNVLVSRRVQRAAGSAFVWETLAPIRVKGKSEPVPVAVLVGKARSGAEEIVYTGALVGREGELEHLRRFVQPALEGRFAGLVGVYGEAGMGKSRLVYELRQELAQQARWITCPAEQILRQSLYPFKHFLRQYFEQYTDSPVKENEARFTRTLTALLGNVQKLSNTISSEIAGELERTRSMLGALVDLHWEGSLYERLEPKLRFENTLAAFKALIQAESLQQPLIMHVEDAHWLDMDSHELIKVLTRNVDAYPFAVLLTGRYRDDGSRFVVDVDADVPQQSIDLDTLSPAGVRTLAAQVLGDVPGRTGARSISRELAAFLAEKTNGNPLFVEQLALDLRERGVVYADDGAWHVEQTELAEVPASVNAVLIARLDRLAARVRAAVQTAAVLGNEFGVQTLLRMLRDDAQVPLQVKQAEDQMIWSALSEMRYIFRHTLLRDAAYNMQVEAHLRELHALAGEAIEHIYAADIEPHYADLAYHHGKAGHTEQEFRYARLAGERAAAQFANSQAIEHFQKALQSADRMDAEATAEQRQSIHTALGELLTTIGQYDQGLLHLGEALALAVARGDREGQAHVCRWLAQAHELRGDYAQALDWVQQGLAALAGRETAEAAELLLIAGLVHTRQGDYDNASRRCEEGLRIAKQLNEVMSLARAYTLLGHIMRLLGKSAIAVEHFQHALDLYQQAGDIYRQATTYNQIANAYFNTGQWQEAEHHYCQARDTFNQVGDVYQRACADNNLGGIMLNQGRLGEALIFYQAGLSALEQISGSAWALGALNMNLGATFTRRGELDTAYRHLQASQSYFEQAQIRDFLPEMHRHFAETALVEGNLPKAEAHAQQALSLARELAMRGEEGCSLRLLGEIALAQRKLDQAGAYLHESLSILKEVGEEYESARSHLALARLCIAEGKTEEGLSMAAQCIPTFDRLGAALDLSAARALTESEYN